MTTTNYVGKPVDRVDGPAKVRGEAKYAGEFNVPGLLYGIAVPSSIAKGKIKHIDAKEALAVPGVVKILTHENRPHVAWFNRSYQDEDAPPGEHFRPLKDEKVIYAGQPIALVIAETFDAARRATALVRVEYDREPHETDLKKVKSKAEEPKKGKSDFEQPKSRGNAEAVLGKCEVKVSGEFSLETEYHNPMEPHASTVVYEKDGALTIYDKTQGVSNSQQYVCNVFGLSKNKVRVLSPYVGGAFGSGLRPQYQLNLAVMAALDLKRSVRVTMTRQQMFTFGHRPRTDQEITLGARPNGELKAMVHSAVAETSRGENFTETTVNWTGMLYKCDDVKLDYKLARLDVYTPLDMRAPGAATGVNALEIAMDELAVATGVDPVELRLRNYAEKDPEHFHRPHSSKELRACYEQGAEKFGWARRDPKPRSMKRGDKLVGWGMASGVWMAERQKAAASATLAKDGKLTIKSGITDIGTGTYTILTQLAAETLGWEIEHTDTKIADTELPAAPLQGGSWTAASVGTAVQEACVKVGEKIYELARKVPESPIHDAKFDDVKFENGDIVVKTDPKRRIAIRKILAGMKEDAIEEKVSSGPNPLKTKLYSMNTHAAFFVEVEVDEDLGMVQVTRAVSAVAAGRILNPKTARSQVLGGVVWGIGMALHEEAHFDHQLGKVMNHNFAEYHIPVNKDVGTIDVIFVPEEDSVVSPIGVKGLGEIGICGSAAAVANAIYHATGKRVRSYPITPDKLLT